MEDIEDPYHVDVVEPGDRPRLAHGPLAHLTLLVGAQTRRRYQFLDRHVPPQRLVMSQQDAPHPALTERPDKPVPAGDAALVHGQHASPPTLSTPSRRMTSGARSPPPLRRRSRRVLLRSAPGNSVGSGSVGGYGRRGTARNGGTSCGTATADRPGPPSGTRGPGTCSPAGLMRG